MQHCSQDYNTITDKNWQKEWQLHYLIWQPPLKRRQPLVLSSGALHLLLPASALAPCVGTQCDSSVRWGPFWGGWSCLPGAPEKHTQTLNEKQYSFLLCHTTRQLAEILLTNSTNDYITILHFSMTWILPLPAPPGCHPQTGQGHRSLQGHNLCPWGARSWCR